MTPTIHETKDYFLVWIKSCTKAEQINLLADIVAEFIVNRFEKLENPITIQIIRDFLIDEMAEQTVLIKRKQPDTHIKFDYE